MGNKNGPLIHGSYYVQMSKNYVDIDNFHPLQYKIILHHGKYNGIINNNSCITSH